MVPITDDEAPRNKATQLPSFLHVSMKERLKWYMAWFLRSHSYQLSECALETSCTYVSIRNKYMNRCVCNIKPKILRILNFK
jgi:hypothetical protein